MNSLSIIDELLLGVALAMDCFAVSFATGLKQKKFVANQMLLAAILFGFFQAFMPLIGWVLTVYFGGMIESFDHWIAFGLLAFVGGKMVKEGMHPERDVAYNAASLIVIVTLAIATSIDALAVGISFTCLGMNSFINIIEPIVIIGICSFVLSLLGNFVGIYIGRKFKIPMELIGGIILIIIGLKILVEHLSSNS